MPRAGPARALADLGGGLALRFAAWFLSVAVVRFFVGSPVTEIYVGFSIAAAALWTGRRVADFFDDPREGGGGEG